MDRCVCVCMCVWGFVVFVCLCIFAFMCMFVSDECGAEVYFTVHASANEYCRFGCFEVGTSFHHRRLLWPAVLRIYSKFFFSTLCSGTAGSVFVSVRACVCVHVCVSVRRVHVGSV